MFRQCTKCGDWALSLSEIRPDVAEFPHLHAHLEGENIDSVKYIHKEGDSWSSALEKQDIKSWLV